jgi:hypothetical protein
MRRVVRVERVSSDKPMRDPINVNRLLTAGGVMLSSRAASLKLTQLANVEKSSVLRARYHYSSFHCSPQVNNALSLGAANHPVNPVQCLLGQLTDMKHA